IESEDSKVSVGNAAKQSHDVVGVGIDCIFNHAKVSTEADLGPQPDVIHLTSLDVPNESSQISSDADMVEQNKKDALETLIRISQHKKPKKSNVARVVSEDYKCTPEDVQLIEYIKTLPGKQVVVNIDSAWLNRNDMECLFHGDIELSGELCQVLQLAEHPVVQKLVDPSLFIHRFTKLLLGRRNNDVSDTALCIVASMKRDWMQTGRKPSGLCGAALYIAALSHGCNYTKADIVSPDAHEISRTYSTNRYYVYSLLSTYDLLFYTLVSVVHVCEATLTKRLIEFENTDSGSLTVFLLRCEHAYIFMPLCYIEEFLATTDESNEEPVSKHSPKSGEIICKHKDKGFEHFAHGLCEKCYNKFTKLSGRLEGGSVPPAFQRAEKKRLEAAKRAEEAAAAKEAALEESLCDTQNSEVESAMTPRKGLSGDKSSKMGSEGLINDSMPPKDPEEG
ncbi:hypothetical protein ACJX0J_022948, partial [Zea mays]